MLIAYKKRMIRQAAEWILSTIVLLYTRGKPEFQSKMWDEESAQ